MREPIEEARLDLVADAALPAAVPERRRGLMLAVLVSLVLHAGVLHGAWPRFAEVGGGGTELEGISVGIVTAEAVESLEASPSSERAQTGQLAPMAGSAKEDVAESTAAEASRAGSERPPATPPVVTTAALPLPAGPEPAPPPPAEIEVPKPALDREGLIELPAELQPPELLRQPETKVAALPPPEPPRPAARPESPPPEPMPEPPVREAPPLRAPIHDDRPSPPDPARPTAEQAKPNPAPADTSRKKAAKSDSVPQVDSESQRKGGSKARSKDGTSATAAGRVASASGEYERFASEVQAALTRAKPTGGPGAHGRGLVEFELSRAGGVLYARILRSSGNKEIDWLAVNVVRKAEFPAPPAELTRKQLMFTMPFEFN